MWLESIPSTKLGRVQGLNETYRVALCGGENHWRFLGKGCWTVVMKTPRGQGVSRQMDSWWGPGK